MTRLIDLSAQRFGRLLVIERYFPGNIRWATAKTQANNRSKREAIA